MENFWGLPQPFFGFLNAGMHTHTHTQCLQACCTRCRCVHTHTYTHAGLVSVPAGLLHEVQARSQRHEYQRLLAECQSLYAHTRLQLLAPTMAARLAAAQAQAPLPVFLRTACEHLLRTCQMEAQLFEQFFASPRDVAERWVLLEL